MLVNFHYCSSLKNDVYLLISMYILKSGTQT
nr:MAG TPA_asm: hypothetical protein [Caudoviricetes sp.]